MMNTGEQYVDIQSFSLPSGSLESVVFEGYSSPQLKELRPIHYRIISLHLSGLKNIDISRQLGIHKQTVVNVVHSRLG